MASHCKDIVKRTDMHTGSPHIKHIGRLSNAMTLI